MELEEGTKLMDLLARLDCSQMDQKWEIVWKTKEIRVTWWNKVMEITVLEIIKIVKGF